MENLTEQEMTKKKKWKKHKPNLMYLNKLKIDNQPKREKKNVIMAWNRFDGLKIENKHKKKTSKFFLKIKTPKRKTKPKITVKNRPQI